MDKKQNVLIVGAGIAGIAAARFEMDKGNQIVLLDSSDRPGGLFKSDSINDHYFDYGTHLLPETGLEPLDEILFGDISTEDFSVNKLIEAGNYFNGILNEKSCYVDTSTLPSDLYHKGCVEILGTENPKVENLEQWYEKRYGKTFGQEIFCPVIKKYFGVDASDLHPSAGYFFDMSRLLAFNQDITETLGSIDKYYKILGHHVRSEGVKKYYPKRGGAGAFIEYQLEKLNRENVQLHLNTQIQEVIQNDGVVEKVGTNNGTFAVDRMIWTIPVALLTRYVPLGVKVQKPKFRQTFLFDYIFDVPLLSNTSFINVYDLNMKSGRITLYQNLSGEPTKTGSCTVEVLSDETVTIEDVLQELMKMGLIAKQAKCLLKRKRDVPNGFPVLDLEYVQQSKTQSSYYHEYFKNINFLGKASEKAFFMTDVLIETYTTLV